MRSGCAGEGLTDAVRRFQWFYTRHVWAPFGAADQSALSPTEWRVLFAVMQAGTTIAAELSRALSLNTGYLSRMLNELECNGFIERNPFAGDGRSSHVSLTPAGKSALAASCNHVRNNVSTVLEAMTPDESSRLMASMETVEQLLTMPHEAPSVRLRGPRPGDFGWIVERETQLANGGAGLRQAREIRAAMVVGDYLVAPDPTRNGCWIAEKDGVSVGGSLVAGRSGSADARIAVLFVEPDARREAIGRQLVEACEEFAFESGYERLSCVPNVHHEFVAPLLRSCGFQERDNDETVWEKNLK
jgi:DNA-binding MarR family transcriptional regulator/GNAT superfamily N-acetyltransferase